MKTQLALALLLAVSTASVQAQQSSGNSSAGGTSSGASPSTWSGQSQSGQSNNQPPAQKPEKVAYAKCCIPPGGDGTTEKPYSSFAEADADNSWNKLSVMPSQADLDKMGGDTLQSQTDPSGSVNLNKSPTITPPPRSTQTSPSGRVIETIGTSNIFDCKCPPPSAPSSSSTTGSSTPAQ